MRSILLVPAMGLCVGCAAPALAPIAAPLPKAPTEIVALTFAWTAGLHGRVEVETQSATLAGERHTRAEPVHSSWTFDVADFDEGLRITPVSAPFPPFLVSKDGRFRGVVEGYDPRLVTDAAQLWGPLVGLWLGRTLEIGKFYRIETSEVGGLGTETRIGARERFRCDEDDEVLACVRLELVVSVDSRAAAAEARLLAEPYLRQLQRENPELDEQEGVVEEVRAEIQWEVLTDPASLLPREAVRRNWQKVVVAFGDERYTMETVQQTAWRFTIE